MVTTDPIADMLIRIRNGYMAKRATVDVPWSKTKESLAKILVANHFLADAKVSEHNLTLTLKYNGEEPGLTEVKRISRPSLRIYVNKNNLPKVLGGMGVAVISTPKGLLTNKQAHKEGLGGEVICELW